MFDVSCQVTCGNVFLIVFTIVTVIKKNIHFIGVIEEDEHDLLGLLQFKDHNIYT